MGWHWQYHYLITLSRSDHCTDDIRRHLCFNSSSVYSTWIWPADVEGPTPWGNIICCGSNSSPSLKDNDSLWTINFEIYQEKTLTRTYRSFWPTVFLCTWQVLKINILQTKVSDQALNIHLLKTALINITLYSFVSKEEKKLFNIRRQKSRTEMTFMVLKKTY